MGSALSSIGGGAIAGGPVGAGLGALNYAVSKPQENAQRNLAANTSYYQMLAGNDPSKMEAQVGGVPKQSSIYQNMLGGAGAGIQMAQQNAQQDALAKQQADAKSKSDAANAAKMISGPASPAGATGGSSYLKLLGGAGGGGLPTLMG